MGHSGPLDAPLVLVGRDYGFEEQRAGRPFVGPAGKLLSRALAKAGIEREQCLITNVVNARPAGNKWEAHTDADIERGVAELHDLLGRRGVRNTLIVALGAESFQACRGLDPRTRPEVEFDGNGITELRGYVFEGPFGPVLASTHPAFILRTWLPWWPCLCWDLQKAKRWFHGENGEMFGCEHILGLDVWNLGRPLDVPIAVDIETAGPHAKEIKCVGFAWNSTNGYVWPYNSQTHDEIGEMLASPAPKVFHNGQFDVTVLERQGLKVNNWTDDTMLLWHVVEPLLAGKKKEKGDETVKSLRFLASLLTDEPWWKCMPTSTFVLMSDLRWRTLGELAVGDTLLAFDEQPIRTKRRWRFSQVKQLSTRRMAQCLRIVTDKGSLVLTPEHRILARSSGSRTRWYRADELRPDWRMRFAAQPWHDDVTNTGGWLAGIADGEGSVGFSREQKTGWFISIAQKPGLVLSKIETTLSEKGFKFSVYSKPGSTSQILIWAEHKLRFLGELRPVRLLNRFREITEAFDFIFGTPRAKILRIEDAGAFEVMDIATSTGTFIADGFAVHNCYDFQSEEDQLRLCAKDSRITWACWDKLRRML